MDLTLFKKNGAKEWFLEIPSGEDESLYLVYTFTNVQLVSDRTTETDEDAELTYSLRFDDFDIN